MWSWGITLVSGQYDRGGFDAGEVMPEHLCGGTYRSSRKRQRKVKEKLTYKERQARRIAKKFGTNGLALGADEKTKARLEKGKKTDAKPRVAGSARGRELRAAAALARFETPKDEPKVKDQEDIETESETESEDGGDADANDALDINGKKMLDTQGRGMVKVCEDEDKNDVNAQDELAELQSLDINNRDDPSRDTKAAASMDTKDNRPASKAQSSSTDKNTEQCHNAVETINKTNFPSSAPPFRPPSIPSSILTASCSVCSMENDAAAATCFVCANVLDPSKVPSIWRCQNETCRDGSYINAGDCGVCGVCGARKCSNGI
jgi:hypothetical protein